MLGSVFCFAIVNAIAKSHSHLPVHELVLSRGIVSFIIASYYVKSKGIPYWGNNKFWLVMRGLMGVAALLLFFSTIMHMPLASASTIQYLSPVFTVLIATQMNNQSVKPVQWIYFGIALVGTAMIKGFDARVSMYWLGIGVLSALFTGLAYNSIIKSKGTDHPMTIVLYNPLVSIPITVGMCFYEFVLPQGVEWLWLLALGLIGHVAQYLMTLSLHTDIASKVTPWNYFGAVFALLIGYFLFDETIVWMSLLGMLLVVTGVILNARVKTTSLTK